MHFILDYSVHSGTYQHQLCTDLQSYIHSDFFEAEQDHCISSQDTKVLLDALYCLCLYYSYSLFVF